MKVVCKEKMNLTLGRRVNSDSDCMFAMWIAACLCKYRVENNIIEVYPWKIRRLVKSGETLHDFGDFCPDL